MHEVSLMRSLLRQVQELAYAHHAVQVDQIEVELGPLSGVEPLQLQSAFEQLIDGTTFATSRLKLTLVELDVRCDDCGAHFSLNDFRFVCQICGSTSLTILRGDSLRLLTVQMSIEQHPSEPETSAAIPDGSTAVD